MIRVLLALLFATAAHAEFIHGKGDTPANPLHSCVLEWDYSALDEARIDGFQFEINGVKAIKVSKRLRRVDCTVFRLKNGLTAIRLYAYKATELSGPSNQLDFYFQKSTVSDDDPGTSSLPIPTVRFKASPSI
jgi:hypothetical protein